MSLNYDLSIYNKGKSSVFAYIPTKLREHMEESKLSGEFIIHKDKISINILREE